MIRLVRAEVRKVRSTRLWIGLGLGGLGLTGLATLLLLSLANTDQGRLSGLHPVATAEDLRRLVFDAAGVLAFVLVLATTMATSEFRYGTAVGTYLATPSRMRVITAKALSAAPIGFVYGAVAGLVVVLLAVGWLAVKGEPVPFGSPAMTGVAQVGLQGAYGAVLAVCFGALVRSQLVAILGLLGWLFLIEPLATAVQPALTRWTPFAGVNGAFNSTTDPGVVLLGHLGALALAAAYVALLWAAAVWAERRRDA